MSTTDTAPSIYPNFWEAYNAAEQQAINETNATTGGCGMEVLRLRRNGIYLPPQEADTLRHLYLGAISDRHRLHLEAWIQAGLVRDCGLVRRFMAHQRLC